MVYTEEDRLKSLELAREAKSLKAHLKREEKKANPPTKGRPPKITIEKPIQEPVIVKDLETEIIEEIVKPEPEPETEEIVEIQKIKKPKKIIRKKIIQQYDSESADEEEIITYVKAKHRPERSERPERPERPEEYKKYARPELYEKPIEIPKRRFL